MDMAVISGFIEIFSWTAIGLLSLFTVRRLVVLFAALLPARKHKPGHEPSVAVIVSVLNEEENLPGLLKSLAELEYPQEKISFTLVDDCSGDRTSPIIQEWVRGRSNALHLAMTRNMGKAEALNQALSAAPPSEIAAVYDADLRPHPASLHILAGAFEDKRIAAASGFRRPSNPGAGPVAAYGALESLIHQLITQAGKDRLRLNPATMGGNCVYRRSALRQAGGFPPGAFSEDIETSLAFVSAGWRTTFRVNAVADCLLVDSLRRYWNQRCRWTRGLYRSGRHAAGLESWLVSAGYADRLVFVASLVMAANGYMSLIWPAIYCVGAMASVPAALWRAGVGCKVAGRVLLSILSMFAVDVAVTAVATLNGVLGRKQTWSTGRRP